MREGEGHIIRCWAFKELFSSKRAGFVFHIVCFAVALHDIQYLGSRSDLGYPKSFSSRELRCHYERGAIIIIEPKTLPSEHVSTSRIGSLLGIIPCTVPDCVMVKIGIKSISLIDDDRNRTNSISI